MNFVFYSYFVWTLIASFLVVDLDCTTVVSVIQNLWINHTSDAIVSGVDIKRVQTQHCKKLKFGQKHMYLDYSAIDEIFGYDRVEELLSKYSFITINLESFCQEYHSNQGRSQNEASVALDKQEELEKKFVPETVLEDENKQTLAPESEIEKMTIKPVMLDENDKQVVNLLNGKETKPQAVSEIGQEIDGILEKKDKSKEKDLDGPIGIDLSNIDTSKIEKFNKTIEKDVVLENILRRIEFMAETGQKPYAATFLLPLMKRVKYDPRSPPTLIEDQIIKVMVGIHIQSISNFELTTMDYDMDMWLRMAWRDVRLAHGFDAPILINEETFLRRVWRPDPFVLNSKLSLFHRVTYLNFYMYVFPNGELFFEARLYLKPKCVLTLCNYPHDSQVCYLRISSIANTNDVVQFHWFPKRYDAIRFNKHVQLPELYIHNFSKSVCDGKRKTGNFSCLEASFNMKRNLGFHLAQTYIPTATCVLFSWISVWLPEEFVEGRIFVALTVFLTLSAESNAAKETLPKVSYIKAIDIWFGFTATFVFSTMLQALVVITLESKSKNLRKHLEDNADSLTVYEAARMARKSIRFHRYGRNLDSFFKVMYPIIFVIFLIIYRFIIIEGAENKCIRSEYKHVEL